MTAIFCCCYWLFALSNVPTFLLLLCLLWDLKMVCHYTDMDGIFEASGNSESFYKESSCYLSRVILSQNFLICCPGMLSVRSKLPLPILVSTSRLLFILEKWLRNVGYWVVQ